MIKDIQKRATHRAKIIDGQIKGLQKMIEEDKYCVDILIQSLAVQKSLRSLNKLVLENHLKTHIKDGMTSGSEKDKKDLMNEMLELYELTNVRG